MPNVTFDDRSLLIDGRRILLVSGSIHYFRVPEELWADRLLKARRAGLNCIATPVAWNYHESVEGQWDSSGDRDVAAFIRLAGELGLYVILQPGPYIGADWDFGGLPPWLTTKTGMVYRTSSAAYTHYYDKYFRQMLPRLAELQVTRGGNIILVQGENAYDVTTMPDRLNYLEFVARLLRRSGFDVPIVTCNRLSEPPLPDAFESVACEADPIKQIKQLRLFQPSAPRMAMEYRPGRTGLWGREHHAIEARDAARRAMEILGSGAQINYHMWHGGTNFGFWAGRGEDGQDAYQTTSYDCDAPLAEGGGLTDKYYLTRLVNLLAQHMGPFLAGCLPPAPGADIHDSAAALTLTGPGGSWAFVTNNGTDEIETARVSLTDGRELTVPLLPLGAAAVPFDLALDAAHVLDYANLTPLGLFGEKILVFHGPAGFSAEVSINGNVLREPVPSGAEPTIVEQGELTIVLINSDLATRTWLVEDTLVFGPAFVGETLEDIVFAPGARQCALLPLEGKLAHRKGMPPPKPTTTEVKLSDWKRISVCVEPVSADLEWRKLDRPVDMDRLGVHHGYAWYRIQWDEPRPRKRNLLLPDCEDRATVYLNGALVGVWGRGDGATRKPLSVSVKRGTNVLTLLADNLGRTCAGLRLGEQKGLFGHIHDAKALRPRKPKLHRLDKFARRIVPRGLLHLTEELERLPLWALDVDLPMTTLAPVQMSFTNVPHHVAALCNERLVGFFPGGQRNFGDLTLGAGLKKGKNLLRLLLWGDVDPAVADRFTYHSLAEPISQQAKWGWRPWDMPTPGGPVVGKDQPAWYAAEFSYTPRPVPLFVHVAGARKGQLVLNGHNVGRFWTIGPQQYYYLPECWLAEENELLLFVEQGDLPRRTRLELRPLGPYRP
jgi:beta-galactosidase